MKIKQGLFAWILLVNVSYSLFIPLNAFNQSLAKSSNDDELNPISDAFANFGICQPAPEVMKLIQIFDNITQQTEKDLTSFFLTQDRTIALLSLQFWAYLLKLLFITHSGLVLSLMDELEIEDLFFQAFNNQLGGMNFLNNLDNSTDFKKETTNTEADLVSWPRERGGFTLSLQLYNDPNSQGDKSYGQEMSYQTLQKWIEDYGLSASSLRDYLETYLFAGDHLWTAEIAALLSENEQEAGANLGLRNRLAVLGENIKLALASIPFETQVYAENDDGVEAEFTHEDNQHFGAATHVPFRFEGSYSDDKDVYETKSSDGDKVKLEKRSTEDPSDFNPLVYSFLRLDTEDDYEMKETAINDDGKGELNLMQLKHRIFDNDQIVAPISTLNLQESSPRSKDYRQVVYDAIPVEIRLAKREEDCVPVTWYNVFHHSVFGKHKFCHV